MAGRLDANRVMEHAFSASQNVRRFFQPERIFGRLTHCDLPMMFAQDIAQINGHRRMCGKDLRDVVTVNYRENSGGEVGLSNPG